MEEEVLSRYNVKKRGQVQVPRKSKPVRCVVRECLAGLRKDFSNVCKCSVFEGMDPAKDVGRNKHLIKFVRIIRLRGSGDNWEICQAIVKEGTAGELEQHIAKKTHEARQQRLEFSVSHKRICRKAVCRC